jgi:hypothetical protein
MFDDPELLGSIILRFVDTPTAVIQRRRESVDARNPDERRGELG